MTNSATGIREDRIRKGLHENYARFFEDPRREHLRDLLRASSGEYAHLDYKREWPPFTSLARHALGFANAGGGAIVVGIENGTNEAVGVAHGLDKSDVVKGIGNYLPRRLLDLIEIHDFRFDDSEYPRLVGKLFQVLLVEDSPESLPFLAFKDGDGIRANAIYVRRGSSTEEASDEEVQAVLNRRIETGHSSRPELDLEAQLSQLKVLFSQISRGSLVLKGFPSGAALMAQILGPAELEHSPNPDYPKEDFNSFIVRMIELKKQRIEIELDVVGLKARESVEDKEPD